MVELIVNNEGLDLGAAEISMAFQVNDIGTLESRQGDFSYEFELPGTQKNRRLLNRPEGINADVYEKIDCIIKNGNELKRGYLQVMSFKGLIRANFYAGNTNWISDIGEKLLSELDLTDLNHEWTEANVTASFNNTEGYIYPYINIDGALDADLDDIAHTDLLPATYVSDLIKKIFADIDHKISGEFIDSPNYKRLILPYVKSFIGNTEEGYNERSMKVGLLADVIPQVGTILWDDFVNRDYFTTSYYSSVTGLYTADSAMTIDHHVRMELNVGPAGTCRILKNGVTVVTSVAVAFPTTHINVTDQCVAGDTYEVEIVAPGVNVDNDSYWELTPVPFGDGDTWDMSNTLPEIAQIDLVRYLAVSFGLIITYDEYSKTVIFNEFRKVKQNPSEDWSSKIADEPELDFFEFVNKYARKNYLRYAETEDTDLVNYRSQNGIGYGDGIIEVNNEFLASEQDTYTTEFAATYFEGVTAGANTANILKYERDDKPRILLCVPDTDIDDFADFSTINVGVTAVTEIAWAYFAKYKLDTDLDSFTLNLSYDNPFILNVNGEGLSEKYWPDYQGMLQEPIMFKAMFKLTASDILNLDYSRPKYLEYRDKTGYYYLNLIDGYKFDSRAVLCELVKLNYGS